MESPVSEWTLDSPLSTPNTAWKRKPPLQPEIHQAPSLDTLIHAIFLALAINYANQGYTDGRAILTTKNTVVNSLNIQIAKVVPKREHVFLSADSVETGDDQVMAIGTKIFNTITLVGMPPHCLTFKLASLLFY
jgi:hypothetical protein